MKQKDKIRFDRVGFLDADGEEVSGWLALIDTEEKLRRYCQYKASENAQIWFDIKNSPEDKAGHCRTRKASIYKDLLAAKIEKSGKKSMNMVDALMEIAKMNCGTHIKIFLMDGAVYANQAGGCRDTHLRDDGRCDEYIFETCYNSDFIFPSMSESNIQVVKWPGGNHFYITIDGKTTDVDGVEKWNTVKGVEEAKKTLLERNRFKGSKIIHTDDEMRLYKLGMPE